MSFFAFMAIKSLRASVVPLVVDWMEMESEELFPFLTFHTHHTYTLLLTPFFHAHNRYTKDRTNTFFQRIFLAYFEHHTQTENRFFPLSLNDVWNVTFFLHEKASWLLWVMFEAARPVNSANETQCSQILYNSEVLEPICSSIRTWNNCSLHTFLFIKQILRTKETPSSDSYIFSIFCTSHFRNKVNFSPSFKWDVKSHIFLS